MTTKLNLELKEGELSYDVNGSPIEIAEMLANLMVHDLNMYKTITLAVKFYDINKTK